MRLDHVSYAADQHQLVDVARRLGSALGARFHDGGRHPRFGTQNFVIPLAGGTYLEIVAALEHPSAYTAPFGQAVRQRAASGGGWLAWVVAVDDIAPVERRLSRPAVPGNRYRPDGAELHWKQIGVQGLLSDPVLPFFVQWLIDPADHPSAGAPGDLWIEALELAGDPAAVHRWLGNPLDHPLDDVAVEWVTAEEPGVVAVHVRTAGGVVRLD